MSDAVEENSFIIQMIGYNHDIATGRVVVELSVFYKNYEIGYKFNIKPTGEMSKYYLANPGDYVKYQFEAREHLKIIPKVEILEEMYRQCLDGYNQETTGSHFLKKAKMWAIVHG